MTRFAIILIPLMLMMVSCRKGDAPGAAWWLKQKIGR
jgi:hypothetical protein